MSFRICSFFVITLGALFLSSRAAGAAGDAFELVESFPASGAEDVSLSDALQLRFSDAVAVETLGELSLARVLGGGGRAEVAIRVATDLTNASITVVPQVYLDPESEYELIASAKLQSRDGSGLEPFALRFRTGVRSEGGGDGLLFAKEVFDDNRSMTTVVFGPDRRLYAADAFGTLARWELDESGQPLEREVLLSDPKTSRQYIDLEWDPDASAENLMLWVSYGERTEYEEDRRFFTGTVAKLRIGKTIEEEVVVKGLPHGRERQGGFETLPHQPNGLVFRDGFLYQSVGSTSSSGGPSNWGIEEQLLSGCLLEIAYREIEGTLDVHPKTGYDPYVEGASLRIYATGIRNALELVAHSNGKLYTAVNLNDRPGPADGVPDDPDIPGDQNKLIRQTTPNQESLLLVEKGRHYGFPNPKRGQFVLSGGNPTDAEDPFEISDYPVGTLPEAGFAADLMYPIWQYGGTSPNGMIEYLPQEAHPFAHALFCCFYSAGDIAVMELGEDGMPLTVRKLSGKSGKLTFNGPLDITMDPETGVLYVADFGTQNTFGSDGAMVLLRPVGDERGKGE